MSLFENTSMDMPTLQENYPATTFVKEPNVQQTTENREIPKAMVFAPITPEHVANIQSFLKDNNDVKDLINDEYKGPIDGKLNKELEDITAKLEFTISKIINKNIGKIILNTTANDLKSTIKTVMAYKNLITPNQHKFSQDQRFYELGKMLIEKNKK